MRRFLGHFRHSPYAAPARAPSTLLTAAETDRFYDDLMSGAFEDDNEEPYVPPSLTPSGNAAMPSAGWDEL